MKKLYNILISLLLLGSTIACGDNVVFYASTLPVIEGVTAEVLPSRNGDEWNLTVRVKNTTDKPVTIKVALAAEPRFEATSFLIPGINYNGNAFGENLNLPQGWEMNGEPWIFAYDRGSIPSCTITENRDRVFALFASDRDEASYKSSCSLERLEDGSFRHLIYWPIIEAPLCYSNKMQFTERIDNYITIAAGEEFVASAHACQGRPRWEGYGFAEVFPVAWRKIDHTVPAQWSVDEVLALDKRYQDWSRCQDENGYWYEGIVDDMVFRAGYSKTGLSDDGHNIPFYEQHPERNRWNKDVVERAKRLKEGEYIESFGRDIGFAGQTFHIARLAMEYGFRNNSQEDIDYGLKVFRSWIAARRYESGIFTSNRDRGTNNRDASNMGWSISELSRIVMLLNKHGMDGSEFLDAVKPIVEIVIKGVREDGAIGSIWNGPTGEVVNYNGDSAGFVMMGLARYHQLTGDERILPILERAFDYYYTKDINHFRCYGGAMDCSSIDKEGIHPFFTTAKYMYEVTADKIYLEYARKAAWYFVSWLYIHNPIYGPNDDFTLYNWLPAGANIIGVEHSAVDEYGIILLNELLWLAKVDNEPLWREVVELMWRNGTQGFAYEGRNIWHGLERPIGSKNEAWFPCEWNKYATVGRKRGAVNDHLTAWAGAYRTTSIYEMEESDLQWLREATKPER